MNFDRGQKSAMEMRKHREIYIFPAGNLKTREPFSNSRQFTDSLAIYMTGRWLWQLPVGRHMLVSGWGFDTVAVLVFVEYVWVSI